MSPAPMHRFSLDERDHQILDTLDSIGVGPDWRARSAGSGDGEDRQLVGLHAAIAAAGEDPEEVDSALDAAPPLLSGLVILMADHLLAAAQTLATTAERGALEPAVIATTQAVLAADPELAPALASAVEAVGVSLGLTRESLAWAVLVELGDRAQANASPELLACSDAIAERLTAARPSPAMVEPDPDHGATATTPGEARAEPSGEAPRALRVFRSAAVSAAGPEIRARFLADRPEHLALARALVEVHTDPATLVDQFDAGVRALAEAGLDAAADSSPEAVTDGPKRKFTIVHVILAAIILGLTLWHYVLR